MDLARVVTDAQLTDARQSLQFVLVEDVPTVVPGQVASVVPRLPEQTRQ